LLELSERISQWFFSRCNFFSKEQNVLPSVYLFWTWCLHFEAGYGASIVFIQTSRNQVFYHVCNDLTIHKQIFLLPSPIFLENHCMIPEMQRGNNQAKQTESRMLCSKNKLPLPLLLEVSIIIN
jgi:hypothetical protein